MFSPQISLEKTLMITLMDICSNYVLFLQLYKNVFTFENKLTPLHVWCLCLFTGACRMYVVWSLCVSVCVALPRCPGSLFKWGFSVRCPAVREISLLPSCADDGLRLGGVNWPPHLLYRCHLDSSRAFCESVVPLRSRSVLQPNSVPFSAKLKFQLPTYGSSGKYSQPFTFFTFYVTALLEVVLN